MQTEKSHCLDQGIMPETLLNLLWALSVYPWVGISWSASEMNDRFYLSNWWEFLFPKQFEVEMENLFAFESKSFMH